MRLNDLHKEVRDKLSDLSNKDVQHKDYEQWLKHDLTMYMRLQLEEVLYRTYKGEDINWTVIIEKILNDEPAHVLDADKTTRAGDMA